MTPSIQLVTLDGAKNISSLKGNFVVLNTSKNCF